MPRITKAISKIALLLKKKIPYLFTLKNVLVISLFLGGIQVFITIFLEPHATGEYQAPYRNARLAGYTLCFVLPFLITYGFEKWIYNLQGRVWKVYQEVTSKFLLVILISTASYFYNTTVINSISPSWDRWVDHMLIFAWPYIPLFIPFMVIIYIILCKYHSPEENTLIITGQNQDDRLKITESQFIYAKSDQNYVTVYYKTGNQTNKVLLRSPLKDIEDQIDNSVRVHRSFLINPTYMDSIEGNKRKRSAKLKGVDVSIPVSANFEEKLIPGNSI